MRNQNSIIYSEYTLNKFKEYLLKNVDIIKIRYDLIYLYANLMTYCRFFVKKMDS